MSEGQKRGEEDKQKPGIWFLSLSLEPDLKSFRDQQLQRPHC